MIGKLIIYNIDGSVMLEYAVDKLPISIGRTPPNDLIVNHTSISRQHAQIQLLDGNYVLIDKNSTNGVKLKGHRIDQIYLNDEMNFQIGDLAVHFIPAFSSEATRVSSAPLESDIGEKTIVSPLNNSNPTLQQSSSAPDDSIQILDEFTPPPSQTSANSTSSSIEFKSNQDSEEDDIFSANTFVQLSNAQSSSKVPLDLQPTNQIDQELQNPEDPEDQEEENIHTSYSTSIILIFISILASAGLVYFAQFNIQETLKTAGSVTILSLALGYIFSYLNRIRFLNAYLVTSAINFTFIGGYLLLLILNDEYSNSLAILGACLIIVMSIFTLLTQLNYYTFRSKIENNILFIACALIGVFAALNLNKRSAITYNLSYLTKEPPHLWMNPTVNTHPMEKVFEDLRNNSR